MRLLTLFACSLVSLSVVGCEKSVVESRPTPEPSEQTNDEAPPSAPSAMEAAPQAPSKQPTKAPQRIEVPRLAYTAPTETIAPPQGVARPAFDEGAWVRYNVTWREGARSSMEYRLIERDGDAWWLEVIDQRPGGTRLVRMNVAMGDRTDIENVDVRSVTIQAGGQRQEIPARVLPGFQPMLRQWLNPIFSVWEPAAGEEVTVPAGTFSGCVKVVRSVGNGPEAIEADVWLQAGVPITGMVRFQPKSNGGHALELEAFGTDATSVF